MKTKTKVRFSIVRFLKNLFTKNILIKLLSLLFAMLIWGYVLSDQNPVRTKTVADVPVNFDGESDLIARRLVVRSDRAEALKSITVKVDTELTKYADLDANDITASISLRNVSGPGTYALPIYVTATDGTVVSPLQEVTVEIDNLVSKRIPVEVSLLGTLPDGYWSDTPELASGDVIIEGSSMDISSVVKAVCSIDLSARTETYNESATVELQNSSGEVVKATLLGELPSIPVKLTILRMEELPINVDAAITGRENLPVNYEIVGTSVSPSSTITIIGSKEDIDGLRGIDIEPIDVSDRSESVETEVKLLLPEGVTSLDGDTISVRVNIRQKLQTLSLPAIPIKVRGLGNRLASSLDIESTDITITGEIGIINGLSRNDVVIYADVTGLSAGTYPIALRLALPNEKILSEVTYVIAAPDVNVTIRND
jgi:YbbR domain-containing protein